MILALIRLTSDMLHALNMTDCIKQPFSDPLTTKRIPGFPDDNQRVASREFLVYESLSAMQSIYKSSCPAQGNHMQTDA